tara:strand:- start:8122 stop:8649 length:528 start_codon:yes stop_codon:yes gene_type:complete
MKRVFLLITIALFSSGISAGPIQVFFEFGDDQGPWGAFSGTGSISFDESIIPLGGGYLNEVGLLTGLSVTVGGIAYDEATANTGWLEFSSSGELESVAFGTHCEAGACYSTHYEDLWYMVVSLVGHEGVFVYRAPDFAVAERGYVNTTSTVPAPATLALFGLGVAGLCWSRRKKA